MTLDFRPLLLSTGFLSIGLIPAALACQICVPFPTKSAADYLIEGDAVVLAREDPERPFYFEAVEVLKGVAGEEPIDLFLDSSTRRLLKTYPEHSVVVVSQAGKGKVTWKRIGMADAQFEPLVREVLDLARAWEESPRLRIEYFGKLIGHKDPQINGLAHLEIGRAPYSEIKRLKGALSRDEIHAFLKNFRYVEWHALYILLLAQSEDVRDREFVSQSLRSAARFGTTTRLAAWATAAIELEEAAAIDFIEAEYFRNSKRSAEELEAVVKALSVHGSNGHTHLRDRIVASYGILLAEHPSMAAHIAKDLIAWKRTELADEISKFVSANPGKFDFQTTLRLRAYARSSSPARK